MAKGIRKCKICGNEYEYCHTQRKDNVQRWQDVACCIEHAMEYFKKIEESRKFDNETDNEVDNSAYEETDIYSAIESINEVEA